MDTRNAYLMDVFVNELGDTVKRPCLQPWVDLGSTTGTDGLFWWDEQQALVAVNNGVAFKIINSTGEYTPLVGATVPVGNKVSFASSGSILLYTNGGPIVKYYHQWPTCHPYRHRRPAARSVRDDPRSIRHRD